MLLQERIIKAVDMARVCLQCHVPLRITSTLTLYASSDCRPLRLDSVHHLRWVHEEQPSAFADQVRFPPWSLLRLC